jgi:tetratricopeptide (TPR) repeat protein
MIIRDVTSTRPWIAPAVIALIGVVVVCGCGPSKDSTPESRVVRVTPFEVQGQSEGAEFVGGAFARSLARSLDQVGELEARFVGDAARETEPGNRLTGTLVRDGSAVHARLELSDAEGAVSWETEVDSEAGDLSALASRSARLTAGALGVPFPDLYGLIGLVIGGPEMSASPITARVWDSWRRDDIATLVESSTELVERFPDEPAARALSAWAFLHAWDAKPSSEKLARLKEGLVALDESDPSSPYDELMLGYVYRSSGEPDAARDLYSRVLARNDLTEAARAWALRQRSYTHLQTGHAGAGLEDAERAVELDPSSAPAHSAHSRALEALEKLDDGIASSRNAVALEPFSWRQYQRLGIVLSRAGDHDEAVASLATACEIGGSQEACANLAVVLQKGGRPDEASAAADHAASLAGTPWGHYNLACYRAISGDGAMAVQDLRGALDLGFADALISTDTDFDSIRGDPRFEAIAEEVDDRLRSRRETSVTVFPWQS